jgi:peptide-methionine (R)-S-oxide reductase
MSQEALKSIAFLSKWKKYALFEDISLENRENYFKISCRPIASVAEDDMELLSDIVTWGEYYLNFWERGTYVCAKCENPLYSSNSKWKGPCRWPSFRDPIGEDSLSTPVVYGYNKYECVVKEVYCKQCDLFIGHQFEDGKLKGDIHPDARWRH